MKVLLIDDKADLLSELKVALERGNFEVETAQTYADGIKTALSWHPDVVYCDYDLNQTGLTGIDLVTKLREYPRFNCTRMVMMTGRDSRQNLAFQDKALTICFDRVIGKDEPKHSDTQLRETLKNDLDMYLKNKVAELLKRVTPLEKEVEKCDQQKYKIIADIFRKGFLNGEDFCIELQPKFNTSKELVGAEVLFRLSKMLLDQFDDLRLGRSANIEWIIALAEELGYIKKLGLWVLHQTAALVRTMQFVGLSLAVNISVKQVLDPVPFFDQVEEILEGLPTGSIELEITESHRSDHAVKKFLLLCKQKKIKTALDDFGEGLTGIGLFEMPFDYIKIDKAFIINWNEKLTYQRWCKFVANEIALINEGGRELKIVAEGVEGKGEDLDKLISELKAIGCNQLQGFGLGRPVSPEEFIKTYC